MKKVTYNVFYKPVMQFIYGDGTVAQPDLGLFSNESDASLAIGLMYDIENTLRKKLTVKLSRDHKVEERQIIETQKVPYYNNLKEFANDNAYMKLFALQEGFSKLNILVDNAIGRHSYFINE